MRLKKTTIRISEDQAKFIKDISGRNWNLSSWVREELDKIMRKDPKYLRKESEKRKLMKGEMIERFDTEVVTLMKDLEDSEKLQEERRKRLESTTPDYEPYGGEYHIDLHPERKKKPIKIDQSQKGSETRVTK